MVYDQVVCEGECVTKDGVRQSCVWRRVCDKVLCERECVWQKMVYDKVVCERECVTKDGVRQSCVWRRVCDKRWCTTKLCVNESVWQIFVWKRVCDKRWCRTKLCVKERVCVCVCDKVVCERGCATKDGVRQNCVWKRVCDVWMLPQGSQSQSFLCTLSVTQRAMALHLTSVYEFAANPVHHPSHACKLCCFAGAPGDTDSKAEPLRCYSTNFSFLNEPALPNHHQFHGTGTEIVREEGNTEVRQSTAEGRRVRQQEKGEGVLGGSCPLLRFKQWSMRIYGSLVRPLSYDVCTSIMPKLRYALTKRGTSLINFINA